MIDLKDDFERFEKPLQHGGNLQQASRDYGIEQDAWLDLSTGVSPVQWPVPGIPKDLWHHLPQVPESLLAAAAQYYGCRSTEVLAVSGSQQLIRELPRLFAPNRVAVPAIGYAEHGAAWGRAGHHLSYYAANSDATALLEQAELADVMVLINPNNPTAHRYAPELLLELHQCLQQHDGLLVVDEAFMDVTPGQSLASHIGLDNLLVMRSMGKFFGLAGARVGFALAHENLLEPIVAALGPWSVSAPALYLAEKALLDREWQSGQRQRLHDDMQQLQRLLDDCDRGRVAPAGLFATCWWPDAIAVHEGLARRGIWTRLLDNRQAVRFGLPADKADWFRLRQALEQLPTTL